MVLHKLASSERCEKGYILNKQLITFTYLFWRRPWIIIIMNIAMTYTWACQSLWQIGARWHVSIPDVDEHRNWSLNLVMIRLELNSWLLYDLFLSWKLPLHSQTLVTSHSPTPYTFLVHSMLVFWNLFILILQYWLNTWSILRLR